MKNTIVLKKVSVILDKKKILNNISFSTSPDLPLCIIGRGSSGKSTLLKSIIGLVDLNNGEILINNISTKDKKIRNIFRLFGVVFQKDALFDSLTVWENIMFKSLNISRKETLISRAKEILSQVGLESNDAFLYPSELSGGMRKRVAIARAISHSPKYLILDEPTAGLDPIKTNMIFEIIKKLTQNSEITLIVVTSDMRGALKYFKKFVVLEKALLHWQGSVQEIKKKPTSHIDSLLGKLC
ncbi:MAG: ATP-binding cassette domain-containing protein [Pseudomonadota bacterium]|nr:ATP-binding cassette domain-containing protein [Pseudomonadota bacterium]